jgi:hypothetical protein
LESHALRNFALRIVAAVISPAMAAISPAMAVISDLMPSGDDKSKIIIASW